LGGGGDIFFKEIFDNLWLFEFAEDSDRRKVLEGRPWSYDRTILIIEELDGQKPPSQMKFLHSPIWVQVHDMPLGCMNKRVGLKIGNSLGKVEEVAVAEDDVGWGRYMRLRVVIDLYQPLDRGRDLILSGNTCWISFKYEKLLAFYFKCGRILHDPKGCPIPFPKKTSHKEGATGWGSLIRANDSSRALDLPDNS
jgi:hypothetical protein